MEAIAEEVIRKMDEYTPHNLSMTAWAYGELQVNHPKMIQALLDDATNEVLDFDSSGLHTFCTALRRLNWNSEVDE